VFIPHHHNFRPSATTKLNSPPAVADIDGENIGGFSTNGNRIANFSALHNSGTGGNLSLGNFPYFTPLCLNVTIGVSLPVTPSIRLVL